MAEPGLGRRERKKEETKRRIYVSALELFHRKGFEHTTVDEITERADVAKGTFFNYFPHKESVLSYLSEEWLKRVEELAAKPSESAADRITSLFTAVAAAYGENRALTHLVVTAGMEQMFCPTPMPSRSRFVSLVNAAIAEGQAGGEFRGDLPPESIFLALGAAFMGTLFWWAGHGHPGDPGAPAEDVGLEESIRSQLTVVYDGIRAAEDGRARG
jgi:TetR/AcrR family transcriptional regulator, cholesterol catabolism regulator